MPTEMELTLEQTQQGVSHEVLMEILLEPSSNKLMVGDFCDSIRIKLVTSGKKRCIKVKEFQRSFRHSDTERLSQSDEVLKLKNFKKDATLKLFKSTNQERENIEFAKLKWALEGDENTRFFHGMLKKKRCQLAIKGILKNGEWIEDPNLVKDEFLNHFRTRFNMATGIPSSFGAELLNPLSFSQRDC
ncbi:hypothetical protein Tco_0353716 [Tanacetum coccineum]